MSYFVVLDTEFDYDGQPFDHDIIPVDTIEEFDTLTGAEMYAHSILNAQVKPEEYEVRVYHTHNGEMPFTSTPWSLPAQYDITDVTSEYEFGPGMTVTESTCTYAGDSGYDIEWRDECYLKTITA